MAADALFRFTKNLRGIHQFWPDDVGLADEGLFDLAVLTGSRQTTDTHLAGVAFRRGGRLATVDGSVNWKAVRGADESLIEQIGG